jgi:hypothetical protein
VNQGTIGLSTSPARASLTSSLPGGRIRPARGPLRGRFLQPTGRSKGGWSGAHSEAPFTHSFGHRRRSPSSETAPPRSSSATCGDVGGGHLARRPLALSRLRPRRRGRGDILRELRRGAAPAAGDVAGGRGAQRALLHLHLPLLRLPLAAAHLPRTCASPFPAPRRPNRAGLGSLRRI